MWLTEIAVRLLRPVKTLQHVGSDNHFHQCQQSASSFKSLQRNSLELNKTRIATRRCSLENAHIQEVDMAYHEELHTALPRQDSIMLAKRRMSHEIPQNGQDAALEWETQPDQANQHQLVRWGGAVAVA